MSEEHLKKQIESTPVEDIKEQQRGESKESPELSKIRIETHEVSEEVEGLIGKEISESTGEGDEISGDYKAGSGYTKAQIQDIKAHLLKNLPSEKLMIKQIRKKLNIELNEVTMQVKEAEKKRNYFLLNKLFGKLRNITEKLAMLKEATYEYLKKLWLKVVHGII